MIAPHRNGFAFNKKEILLVPSRSGVYALYNIGGSPIRKQWIYVGEGEDIQARLLDHFNGDNPCITAMKPTHFQVESADAQERVARQDALILQLGTLAPNGCNQRLG